MLFNDATIFALFYVAFAAFFATHGVLNAAPVLHIVGSALFCSATCAFLAYLMFAIVRTVIV